MIETSHETLVMRTLSGMIRLCLDVPEVRCFNECSSSQIITVFLSEGYTSSTLPVEDLSLNS